MRIVKERDKPACRHDVLISGLYCYRMHTGSFINTKEWLTKKMTKGKRV